MEFDWFRDPVGYGLVEKSWPASTDGQAGFLSRDFVAGRIVTIKRKGGPLERYSPLDKYNFLFLSFLRSVKDAESLLQFVQDYGPLTERGLDKDGGDDVPFVIEHARAMSSWVTDDADGLTPNSRQKSAWQNLNSAVVKSGAIQLPKPTMALIYDPPSGTLKIRISPESLLDALWLQLVQNCQGTDTTSKTCDYCGTPFMAGRGTKRRFDAKFCTPAHQIAYHSRKRSRGSQNLTSS